MAVSTTLGTGATGVTVFQEALRVTSNNIANTDTIAFKESDISFEELIQGGLAGPGKLQMAEFQVGRGAQVNQVRDIFEQGGIEQTTRNLDLTIEGEGFFVLKDPKGSAIPLFTRAGIFDDNKLGLVTNPEGFLLQGAEVKVDPITGEKKVGKIDSIDLSNHTFPPRATTKANFTLNLFGDDPKTSNPVVGSVPTNFENLVGGAMIINGHGLGEVIGADAVERVANLMAEINSVSDRTGVIASTDTDTTIKLVNEEGGPITIAFDLGFDPDAAAKTGLQAGTFLAGGGSLVTGTVDTAVNTKTVTGNGTRFTEELAAGDTITIGSESFIIESVQSDTELTVAKAIDADTFGVQAVSQSADFSTPITFFDSLGSAHLVNVRFQKTATNEWAWTAVVGGKDNINGNFDEVQATGKLGFTPNGQLDLTKTVAATFSTGGFDFKGGAFVDQQIAFDFTGTNEKIQSGATQFGSPTLSTVLESEQDGFAAGVLQNVSVDDEGFINGLYTNGKIQTLYQISVATFPNQEGLTRVGKNIYIQSDDSGEQIQGFAGNGGKGKITANALEQSTVDLAKQFVKLITYQRGFQANSRVITTADEVVQELVNLKR
jgi:flagellar hook protein FlgE